MGFPGDLAPPHQRAAVVIFRPWQGVGWPWWAAWLGRALAPGYGHVALLWWCPTGRAWCYVDPCAWGMAIQPMDRALTWEQVLALCAQGATKTVEITVAEPKHRLCLRGPYTCVSAIKSIIGDDSWAVTPWQLYRRVAG